MLVSGVLGRDPQACRDRFRDRVGFPQRGIENLTLIFTILSCFLVVGRWSKDEVNRLLQVGLSHMTSKGTPAWDQVANVLATRTRRQCMAKWQNLVAAGKAPGPIE